jgi:hypothetical protein
MFSRTPKNLALTEGSEILSQIIKELNTAKSTVDIAMAWFTHKQLLEQVSKLCEKGVTVRIVLAKNDYNSSTALANIKEKGAQVLYLQGSGYGMMHHKFCIIDSNRAITGSFNWTGNAVSNSSENAIFTSDREIIKPLIMEFDKLLGKEVGQDKSTNENVSNFDDPFIEQLESITSALIEDYNHDEIEAHGYLKSKQSNGTSQQISGLFDELLTEFKNSVYKSSNFKERTLVKMDVIWDQKKQTIKANYEQLKENVESEFASLKQNKESIRNIKIQEVNKLEKEKEESRFKKENKTTEIEELIKDNDKLESNSETKPFWNFQNSFVLLAVILFWFYLYLFYSSAIYILQYGDIEVARTLASGKEPRIEFFDSQALGKLSAKGWVAMFFAFLVVHIPISLSLAHSYIKKEWLANLMSYFFAILVVDFFVAFSISRALHEIQVQIDGVKSEQSFWETIYNLEFVKVFIFGALPLMILKFLFQNVRDAYAESKIELVNNKLSKQIKYNKTRQVRLNHDIQNINLEMSRISASIDALKGSIDELNTQSDNAKIRSVADLQDIDTDGVKEAEYYGSIFNKYRNSIEKGSATIVLNAMESRISSSLVGWVKFLNEHFSETVIKERIIQIESIKTEWIRKI